jgi:N-acetylglucosaminyldiphosphoundecaprenol N-acetyl-beta-D-mannosaminyltransferase
MPSSANPAASLPVVEIDGVLVHDLSEADVIDAVGAGAEFAREQGRGLNVVTPNLDHLWILRRDAELRAVYRDSYLKLCDGKPLTWIAKRQKTPFRHGVAAGSSMFVALCREAPKRGWRLFFLGGAPGRADEAAEILRKRFAGIQIIGTHCPPLGFENNPEQWDAMKRALADANASEDGPIDLVFLALGAPKSEKTAAKLIAEDAPAAVYLNVGAAFDFVCGKPKRAPVWMRRVGLEWFYRLSRDPRRLFRRYIIHDLPLLAGLMLRPRRGRIVSEDADFGK